MRSRKRCLMMVVWMIMWAVARGSGYIDDKLVVKVGVVLDLKSRVGNMSKISIQLARSDFYTQNPNYKTKLSLFFRHAGDVVEVASVANKLVKVNGVEVIIGPQTSEEATYLKRFGRKCEIPIISFAATSPSLSPKHNPYFISAAQSDMAQVEAIHAIIQAYGWQEIVPIYEDTVFGRGIIPYLASALRINGTLFVSHTLIPWGANESEISSVLKNLKSLRRMTFLLHMTASVGSKVLIAAKNESMMSEGYAWIVTDGVSCLVDPITDSRALEAMQGIVGVRPCIPNDNTKFQSFLPRFNKQLQLPLASPPNIFALQAYDAVWALAMGVERVNSTRSGSAIMDAMVNTKFQGITGNFNLVDRELKGRKFEVFNVVDGKERIIQKCNNNNYNKKKKLVGISKLQFEQQPIWPGQTTISPWMNLSIGIPLKPGFEEFVKVDEKDPRKSSGFAIDVFNSVVEILQIPIHYHFVPFINQTTGESNGSYDQLLSKIALREFDAVVGDITIFATRSELADFTLPYSESGVSMLVSVTSDEKENMWIFLKPFKWNLWLVSFVSFLFTGSVVWLLECRHNTDFGTGLPQQQIGLVLWFSFSTLVFAHRERILNNLSRFLLVIWVFVVLILTQSYTANLSSMLTTQRLRPSFLDVNEIRQMGYVVGFQNDSFVRDFLITRLGFADTNLKSFGSPKEFKEALNNGVVAAIFDEIPYIKVFLRKYPYGFQMVGPVYRTGGFGFAFPKGSSMTAFFSRAILNVTEDDNKMSVIEHKYFSTQDVPPIPDSNDLTLDVYRFGGLFVVTTVATCSSLLIYLSAFLLAHWHDSGNDDESLLASKMVKMGKLFYNMHFQTSQSRVHSVPDQITETTTDTNHVQDSTEQPHNSSVENETPSQALNVESHTNATN